MGVYSTVEVHGYIVAFCRGFSFRGRTGTDYISHPSGDDEIRPGEKIAVRESLTATAFLVSSTGDAKVSNALPSEEL